jgi:hypothetical protein
VGRGGRDNEGLCRWVAPIGQLMPLGGTYWAPIGRTSSPVRRVLMVPAAVKSRVSEKGKGG